MRYKSLSFTESKSFKLIGLISFLIGYLAAVIHSGDVAQLQQELIATGALFLLLLIVNYITHKTTML